MRNLKETLEAKAVSALEKVILSFSDNSEECHFVLIDEIPYPSELIKLESEE
ncbi:hypothetical protein [Fusibacter bizertensis]